LSLPLLLFAQQIEQRNTWKHS